jgi:hypothetical protein
MSERLDEGEEYPESLTRRILTLGLGAYFLTEDTVRRYVKDAKIPRDIARGIVQNATKGKEELYTFVARELQGFLNKMDIQQELDRFVRSHKVRISAEIEFLPKAPPSAAEGEGADPERDERPDAGRGPAVPDIEWNVSLKRDDEPKPPPP